MRNRENVIAICSYPMEIRHMIDTTKAIECGNRFLCKVIQTQAIFPSKETVLSLMDSDRYVEQSKDAFAIVKEKAKYIEYFSDPKHNRCAHRCAG
ncbi:MAG: hypothetical protein HC800_20180 [Phormidesmis sp. RL_2_1]|nr:hypothetical protein [Phormidesmis sp. RL_2_1]